jgi:cell division ATPase FtsA
MKQAGFDMNKLSAGFVLTGGASAMTGLPELFTKQTDMPVKFGQVQKNIDYGRYVDVNKSGNMAVLMGLALSATENCSKEPEPVEEAEHVQEAEKIIIAAGTASETTAEQEVATHPDSSHETANTYTVKEADTQSAASEQGQQQQEETPVDTRTEKPISEEDDWRRGHNTHATGLRGLGRAFLDIFSDDRSTKRD